MDSLKMLRCPVCNVGVVIESKGHTIESQDPYTKMSSHIKRHTVGELEDYFLLLTNERLEALSNESKIREGSINE